MRVWFKLLLGALAGLILGWFWPSGEAGSWLTGAADVVSRIGRYLIFPLVLFSTALAVQDLRREQRLGRILGRSLGYTVLGSLLAVAFGTLLIFVANPQRVPIASRRETALTFQSWFATLDRLVPRNAFQILPGGEDFLLPIYVLAFLLGWNFTFDREVTKPASELFDSFSRILYHINAFLTEILGLGLVVLGAALLVQLRSITDWALFTYTAVVLSAGALILVLGIFPLLLYIFGPRENPYKWIFGLLGASLTALLSGDAFLSLGPLTRFSRENLGVTRKVGALNLPLLTLFGRSGTALVTTVAFFVILRSYSSLEITYDQVLWTMVFSFLMSFTLPSVPTFGAYIALAGLCGLYGKGLENGYLNLQPLVPLMAALAAFVDTTAAGLTAFLVARHEGTHKNIQMKSFL